MNLRNDIQSRARIAGLTPNKLKGQHFLVDERIRDRVLAAAIPHLTSPLSTRGRKELIFPPSSREGGGQVGDVLEIGPGLGVLTDELVKHARQVDAVDIDEQEVMFLRKRYVDNKNITIHHQDALDYAPLATGYSLISNLPYEITTPFLWRYLLELPLNQRPQQLVLLIQKEVADRILQNKPPFNPLALLVQWFGEAKRVMNVSRHAFWPEPRVEGAVIKITRQADLADPGKLFALIRAGFSHPRRQLAVNLRAAGYAPADITPALTNINLPTLVRAEALDLPAWQAFSHSLPGRS